MMPGRNLKNKKVIIFDLDGTLAPSKLPMSGLMSRLLMRLLSMYRVAVIGGGRYEQFKSQLLENLPNRDTRLNDLSIFPTNATALYRFDRGKWKKIYAHDLSAREKNKIKNAFRRAFADIKYSHQKKIYGVVIEDRGTQITFSALGQQAPLKAKERWNKKQDVRPELMRVLRRLLPEFEVRSGGLTSIDITKKGIDKAYGVREIAKRLKTPIKQMIFVGDAIYPGGNDYAAIKTGIDYVRVVGPEETAKLIRKLLR